jgi:hypothetical protein
MTDDSAPRFDPRFNPEFQPGYTPGDAASGASPQPPAPLSPPSGGMSTPGTAASAPGTDAPAVATPWRSSRRAAEAGTPVASVSAAPTGLTSAQVASAPVSSSPPASVPTSSAQVSSAPASSTVVSSPTFESSAASDSAFTSDDTAPSIGQQLRNPFLLGLLVVAVALVIVGSWIFAQAYAAFSDTGNFASPADFVALESAMRVAPIVILGGIGVAVAVLFLFARSWRPRK